ncbi:MAG: hypothetical protein ACTSYA_10695 [Candidatus Kariarchaeaceae archaeon]
MDLNEFNKSLELAKEFKANNDKASAEYVLLDLSRQLNRERYDLTKELGLQAVETMLGQLSFSLASFYLESKDHSQARVFLDEALSAYQAIGDQPMVAEISLLMAQWMENSNKPILVINHLETARAIYEAESNLDKIIHTYFELSRNYSKMGNSKKALEISDLLYDLVTGLERPEELFKAANLQSFLFHKERIYEKALSKAKTALETAQKLDNNLYKKEAKKRLGEGYLYLNQYKRAINEFRDAYTLDKLEDNVATDPEILHGLIESLINGDLLDEAQKIDRTNHETLDSTYDMEIQAYVRYSRGKLHLRLENYAKAKRVLDELMLLALRMSDYQLIIQVNYCLIEGSLKLYILNHSKTELDNIESYMSKILEIAKLSQSTHFRLHASLIGTLIKAFVGQHRKVKGLLHYAKEFAEDLRQYDKFEKKLAKYKEITQRLNHYDVNYQEGEPMLRDKILSPSDLITEVIKTSLASR